MREPLVISGVHSAQAPPAIELQAELAREAATADGTWLDELYAARAYDDFYPYDLQRHGKETEGRLNEPHGVGFPLLIAPAYAIGGVKGVELFLAAIAALAGCSAVAGWMAGAMAAAAQHDTQGGQCASLEDSCDAEE